MSLTCISSLCLLLFCKIAGSAELIRDEIIYLAHKAARPEKYPPAEATLRKYRKSEGS